MTIMMRLIFISVLMIFAAPAFSGSASQVFHCEQDEEASDEQVLAAASEWLQAARKLEGGENLELHVHFPVAARMGEKDFIFVVSAPNFAEWGEFMDNYEGSAVAEVDRKYEDIADCPDSSLWESIAVEAK